MKTIRRLYFYAIAFVSMEVIVWGLIGLLRSMLGQRISDSASALAQALSLILVGAPIFLIHWLWAQRASAREEEEKTASLRAAFLYGILLAALIPVAQNLLALINRLFLNAANLYAARALFGSAQTWMDNLVAIAVNLLIAAYFWNTLQTEWKTLPEKENFAEVRRLARFIWMLYGLLFTVYGAQQALHYAFTLSAGNVLGGLGRETVVNAIALLLIGAPIWVAAWKLLQDALTDSSERESALRLGVLYLLSLGGVITVLTAGGNLLYLILMQLFGEGKNAADFLQAIGAPISIGVPFAVLWAYYGNWLKRQFAMDEDAPRRAGKQRFYFYFLALLGLAAATFACSALFALALDMLTGQVYLHAGGFAAPLARDLAFLAAGLPLWLRTWRPMQAEALEQGALGDHARRSVIRKTYLYFALFAAVIGVMVTAGGLMFILINAALGGQEDDLLNAILNALQALIIFSVLLAYHLSVLRRDGELRADALADMRKDFHLAALDHNGQFGEVIQLVFAREAPQISLNRLPFRALPQDQPDAVIFSSAALLEEDSPLAGWIRSYSGNKLIVEEDAAGIFWVGYLSQAVEYARALSEGRQARPSAPNKKSGWMAVVYIFAALFGLEVAFALLAFAVLLVSGG